MADLIIKPVGVVNSDVDEVMLKCTNKDLKLDHNLVSIHHNNQKTQKILIYSDFIECLEGIEDFSYIIVFFWTHKNTGESRQIKKVHPAGMYHIPIKGIFATRSPVRPNPIMDEFKKLNENSDTSKSTKDDTSNMRKHPCLSPKQREL
ncbi:MAG: hypothetical protein RBG13Loki_1893 [Promethearchaeota archaeon CR_4]|nr:MAG: hypothetical protein RBG13Loki_1893 [Candidatus Lokiarchaeota archaeon CR_4]